MHSGRLHAVLRAVADDYRSNNPPERLNEYINCLHQVGRPNPPQISLLLVLRAILLKSVCLSGKTSEFTPSKEKILTETGLVKHVGRGFWSAIDTTIREFSPYPLALKRELGDLLQASLRLHSIVLSLLSGFKSLAIECTQLSKEDSEIGVVLPADVFSPTMEELEKELHDLGYVFRTLSEVVGGDYGDVRIRTISTSDIQVFVACAVPVAAAAAVAIERIVALYKSALEIRKLRKELARHDIPDEILEALKAHLNQRMEKCIQSIATDIVEKYCPEKNKGRRNELQTATYKAVENIAMRIHAGVIFEAQVGKPSPDKSGTSAKRPKSTPSVQSANLSDWRRLNEAGRAMREIESVKEEIRSLPPLERENVAKSEGANQKRAKLKGKTSVGTKKKRQKRTPKKS
jgi:hypothetical protein